PFIAPNTDYAFAASRFSTPMAGAYKPVESYAKTFDGVLAAIKIEKTTGTMALDFEVKMPPMDFDLSDNGKGPSEGWAFFSSYNTELGYTKLESSASQHDQDFITAFNWKAGIKAINE